MRNILLTFLLLNSFFFFFFIYDTKHFFEKTIIDLGCIKPNGNQVTANFVFHNQTGNIVTIMDVKRTCGCIKIEYPTHPINIQETGNIKVTINVNKVSGYFQKTVLVYGLGIKPTILKIKGKIQ